MSLQRSCLRVGIALRMLGIQLILISNRDALQSLGEIEVHLPILRGVELDGIVLLILVGCIGVEGSDGRWHPRTPATGSL